MENQEQQGMNPLKKYFRQPKLYVRLPSSGNFYPKGTLEHTQNMEFPVYAMTARDEIAIKTPDALMNGQSTVDVIQSCMPNIKNAWHIPSIDIDAILIAIRIATYGEQIELDISIPNTSITKTYTTDLRLALDKLLDAVYDTEVKVNEDITAFLRPINYEEFTKSSLKTLEEQRIFNIVNSQDMSEQQKIEQFNKSFRALTEITMSSVVNSIVKIVTPDGDVTDPAYINEFVNNSDKEFFNKITDHLEKQRDKFQMPMFKIATDQEERDAGAPDEFETPISLDASNFFA
jgi:hypothetical protein